MNLNIDPNINNANDCQDPKCSARWSQFFEAFQDNTVLKLLDRWTLERLTKWMARETFPDINQLSMPSSLHEQLLLRCDQIYDMDDDEVNPENIQKQRFNKERFMLYRYAEYETYIEMIRLYKFIKPLLDSHWIGRIYLSSFEEDNSWHEPDKWPYVISRQLAKECQEESFQMDDPVRAMLNEMINSIENISEQLLGLENKVDMQ